MKLKKINSKNQKGSILIGSILVMVLLLGLAISLTSLTIVTSIATKRSYQNLIAVSQAEAVIEKTMWELNSGQTPSCTPSCSFSDADVNLTITDVGGNNKDLVVEAFVPNQINYKAKRKVKVRISDTPDIFGIAFNYALQAGTGGIYVSSSSKVEGNIYSNADVSITNPAKVKDPGNVWAVGSISDPSNGIHGSKNPGATSTSLPPFDTNAWQSLAQAGGIITGDYSPPSNGQYTNLGPKEITGNFTMTNTNQKINLSGPLYIHGDLNISGGTWKIDNSLGSNGTVVLVDGKINISGNADFKKNTYKTYILFASTNTANTSANPAISFQGNVEAKNTAFYALNGAMKFTGSGEIVSMTGKTLYIEGNGEVEYKEGLASASFGGGPGGVWAKKTWQKLKN